MARPIFVFRLISMAKSATGGTRGGLRGGLGDVYYQLTSNPNGDVVQLVKAWNKSKENVNTPKQAIARMICATMMWMMHRLKHIIQGTFEGRPQGANSINYFSQLNLKLIRDIAANHWYDAFLVRYPEKGIDEKCIAPCIISEGSLQLPKCISVVTRGEYLERDMYITFDHWPIQMIDIRRALGLKKGDSLLLINFWTTYASNVDPVRYSRISLNYDINDYTTITQQNFASAFITEGNTICYKRLDATNKRIRLYLSNWFETEYSTWQMTIGYHAVLINKKERNLWRINTAMLTPPDGVTDIPFSSVAASEVFYSWWPEYEGQSYEELMRM